MLFDIVATDLANAYIRMQLAYAVHMLVRLRLRGERSISITLSSSVSDENYGQ